MTPARILHVFATFDLGGPQARTCRLIASLPASWEHLVLAADGRTGAASALPARAGVEARSLPPLPKSPRRFLSLRRLLRRSSADLVCTYNWGAIEAAAAAVLPPRLPLLHHEEGFRPDEAGHQKLRRVVFRRAVLRRAAGLVVPAGSLARIARQSWRVPAERIHRIPNGVDPEHFRPADPEARRRARARFGLPASAHVVGSVGGLRAVKDHALLLRAAATLDEPPWILLAGEGPQRPALEALATDLGLSERTRFAGFLEDPAEAYAALDLFALPSRSEQMPLALVEAMACGLPVVATAVGDVEEILAGGGLTVPPGEPQAFARALATLLADEDLRRRLGAANRRRVRAQYPLAKTLESYTALYRRLIEGRRN